MSDIDDALWAEASPTLCRFAKHIALAPGTLVDLACGEGRHTAIFANMGCDVIGVDIDGGRLEIAKARISRAAPAAGVGQSKYSYGFIQADLDDEVWPLAEAAFGAVLIVHYYSAHTVRKALRLLRCGGVFFLETYGGNGGNWRALPPKTFVRRLLGDNGFQIEFYTERSVGPAEIDAVSVRTFAVKT